MAGEKKQKRQKRLQGELRANPGVRLQELAKLLSVSVETVRRDMNELSQQGLLVRTYGGAAVRSLSQEPSRAEREMDMVSERTSIARSAVSMIKDREVLMIDAGTSTGHFARQLSAISLRITVVTNCLFVAEILGQVESIRVILCPGDLDAVERATFGPAALEFLKNYHADRVFIGASGLTEDGLTEADSQAVWIKRAMLDRAEKSVLLVDHGKFDRKHLEVICPLDRIDVLVTDKAPGGKLARALDQANVSIQVAK